MTSLYSILQSMILKQQYSQLPDYKLYEIKAIYTASSPEYKAAIAVLETREDDEFNYSPDDDF
jgi:hypothetical protein